MALSSPGIGSGLDVTGIVGQLVELERRPVALLQTAKTRLTTQLSSYGLLQSYMGNLQSIANQLSRADFWSRNAATSSDATAVAVTARASAAAGRYSIEVDALATAQSLSTPAGAFADPANVGSGTIKVTVGGAADPIDIVLAPDSSLAAVRDQINAAKAGVTASIIQDGSGPRLVLTASETGVANAVTIDASGVTGPLQAALSNLNQDRPAQDAQLRINGLAITSATNRLENVIDGVDLTLSKVTTAPVDVSVGSDTAALTKAVSDFVAAYNELNRYLATQTRYDEATKTAGPLQGDRTAVGLQFRLRTLVQQPSPASAAYQRLADLGVSLQRDGSLQVDAAKLAAALAAPAEVAKAFSNPGNGLALGFKALADGMLGTDGALTARSEGLRASIKRNEKEQERMEDRINRVRERLLRQYSALDTSLNQLSGLDKFVSQQITNWNKQGER
jgi:flagellar hook-associated protein 2